MKIVWTGYMSSGRSKVDTSKVEKWEGRWAAAGFGPLALERYSGNYVFLTLNYNSTVILDYSVKIR